MTYRTNMKSVRGTCGCGHARAVHAKLPSSGFFGGDCGFIVAVTADETIRCQCKKYVHPLDAAARRHA